MPAPNKREGDDPVKLLPSDQNFGFSGFSMPRGPRQSNPVSAAARAPQKPFSGSFWPKGLASYGSPRPSNSRYWQMFIRKHYLLMMHEAGPLVAPHGLDAGRADRP